MLRYEWFTGDGTTLPPVPVQCLSGLPDGVHNYSVFADDGHGNFGWASVRVTVDRNGTGITPTTKLTIIAPVAGEVITAGTPYTVKWHVDDSAQAIYESSVYYSLDDGATWNRIWECFLTGPSSGPRVPDSRDESCTWRNPGPPSTTVRFHVAAQDDTDAEFAGATSGRVTIKAAAGAVPEPWKHRDIGTVAVVGNATYDAGIFTVSGRGADIWGTADAFHFVHQDPVGPLEPTDPTTWEITTRVERVDPVHAWTKAGLMVRGGLGAAAQHASVFVTPAKGVAFQRRTATASTSVSTSGPLIAAPVWLKLAIRGATITAYYRKNITDLWTAVGSETFATFPDTTIGLAVTSHADGTAAAATFSNVTVAFNPTWETADIGSTGGSFTSDGVITSLTGKGADIWGTSDQFRFAHTGLWFIDGSLTGRVRSVQNVNAWTKAGVMFRESLDANSRYVFAMVTPGKGVTLQYRATTGGSAASVTATTGVAPAWVRITRAGDVYTGYWSKDGVIWTSFGSVTVTMNRFGMKVGLAVTSHDTSATATAVFDDVRIDGAP